MDQSPLISIVLCFYNEEKFLNEAVESVLAQTYYNWELILVDDGSIDKSSSMAKDYAQQFGGKIFYIEHENHSNRGLSGSRNAGIQKVKGQFVAFLDADDVWLPEKLKNQLQIFQKNVEVTVILEASEYWYSWNDSSRHDVLIPVGVKDGLYRPPLLMEQLYPLGKGAAPCPSGIIVRRAVLDRCNFEESFRGVYQMYEDQAFLCKVYLKEVVFVSSACHNRYRQRPSSLVSSVYEGGKYNTVRQYYLNWFEKYYHQQKNQYSTVSGLLHRALMPYRQKWKYRLTVMYPLKIKQHVASVLVKMGLLKYNKK